MPEVNVERKRQPESNLLSPRHQGGWWPSESIASNPFAMMRRMFEDMDRSFGGSFGGMTRSPEHRGELAEGWWPSVEVLGQNGNLVVRADLPGVNKEDVKVEVTDRDLIIQGERKREHEESGRGFYRSERSYGNFSRCIPLPEGAKTDQAKAQFNNGVLEVSVPVPDSKGRQIPIEAGQKR